MRVQLVEINERKGFEVDCGESPQELDLVYPNAIFQEEIRTRARLERMNENVTISGATDTTMGMECGRCSQIFSFPLHLKFNAVFSPIQDHIKLKNQDQEFGSEELGLYHYNGQTIDVGEFVREQILLALPMVPLCRSDCRGLCQPCGRNLNLGQCHCPSEVNNGASKA